MTTDDINPRLSAVEARLDGIDTQLTEIRADIRQLNDRLDRMQADTNDRIDRLSARIERVFWGVIAMGAGIILSMLGLIITLVLKL